MTCHHEYLLINFKKVCTNCGLIDDKYKVIKHSYQDSHSYLIDKQSNQYRIWELTKNIKQKWLKSSLFHLVPLRYIKSAVHLYFDLIGENIVKGDNKKSILMLCIFKRFNDYSKKKVDLIQLYSLYYVKQGHFIINLHKYDFKFTKEQIKHIYEFVFECSSDEFEEDNTIIENLNILEKEGHDIVKFTKILGVTQKSMGIKRKKSKKKILKNLN